MENPVNASLYYPVEPMDGLTNMFRVILDGICSNRLKGYEYLDGREIFDEKYVVKPKDVLDKFQILYQEKPGVGQNAKPTYTVEEIDVPCNEVLSYFIKERWEFNQKTSKYGPRILAICPVLHRAGDFGGDAVKYPMFWLNYEDLRPLLRDHLIMSDGMNNTPRFTMEEFFTLEQYKGDIYKVQNTRGLSLMQQYPNADTLKYMRGKIEAELRGFGDSIWVYEETEADLAAQDSIKAARRAERRARRGDSASTSDNNAKKNRRTKEEVDMAAVEEAKEAKEDEIDSRIESTGTAHSARRSARRR
jgi:gliding motility associated protien GldN